MNKKLESEAVTLKLLKDPCFCRTKIRIIVNRAKKGLYAPHRCKQERVPLSRFSISVHLITKAGSLHENDVQTILHGGRHANLPIFNCYIPISISTRPPLRLPIIVVAFDAVTWGLSLAVDPPEVRRCHRFCQLCRPVVVVEVRRRFAGHSNLNDLSEPRASIEGGPVGSLCCCCCNRERGSDGIHIVEQAQPILFHT